MIKPKIILAQSIIDVCKKYNIQHIVISPGSRNAPLTIGFSNDSFFSCYSIVDERVAAFFALGMAQQIQHPVAVVCTSGSALLNYYPAVAEAYYSHIPLVIISADRPASKIDIGDGQTIRQVGALSNHLLGEMALTEEHPFSEKNELQYLISQSIIHQQPIHLNAPFEEPLYETIAVTDAYLEQIEIELPKNTLSHSDIALHKLWQHATKKMILIGVQHFNEIPSEIIQNWANDSSIVVLTESTSNVYHPTFIDKIDVAISALSDDEMEQLKPDILLTFGGMIVSKRIKSFLRKHQPVQHWHVGVHKAYDTYGCLKHHFEVPIPSFCAHFFENTSNISSDYKRLWLNLKTAKEQKQAAFIPLAPYSDFLVYDFLFRNIPHSVQLHIANSAPVRYAQLFDTFQFSGMFCNRGTSGIDGSTSTAIGAAVVNQKQTVFITGDLSFFYDSNALWNTYIPKNFKIIVVNNGGGGIFRILPGHQETHEFNTFFETQHGLDASHLCKMFNLHYTSASSMAELTSVWALFMQDNEKPSLLEIHTPTTVNDKVLKDFFNAIA